MKKLNTVRLRIAHALLENEGGFMSISEIAAAGWGAAYMPDTKKVLEGKVLRSMAHATALLSERGFMVVKDLERTKNGKSLKYKKVLGYKIAQEGDERHVAKNLISKADRVEGALQLQIEFQTQGVQLGMINNNLKLN